MIGSIFKFVKAIISCTGGVLPTLPLQLPDDNVALNVMAGAGAGGVVTGFLMVRVCTRARACVRACVHACVRLCEEEESHFSLGNARIDVCFHA